MPEVVFGSELKRNMCRHHNRKLRSLSSRRVHPVLNRCGNLPMAETRLSIAFFPACYFSHFPQAGRAQLSRSERGFKESGQASKREALTNNIKAQVSVNESSETSTDESSESQKEKE